MSLIKYNINGKEYVDLRQGIMEAIEEEGSENIGISFVKVWEPLETGNEEEQPE